MSKTIALTTVFEDAVYGVPMSYHVIEHISTEKSLRTGSGSATAVVASYASKAAHARGLAALSTTALNFGGWDGSEPEAWLYAKLVADEQDGGGNTNPFYKAKPVLAD